ncbi:hypothetical protein GCM10008957_50810 [Deinococcus ruber]|uniref:Uncharacterized protein n=1 Tax=Deinococcus ruber TaxID=1848197 RepID=A0A918FFB0_9DEIO|nr:hypothetical protein GCM10008957_50810 [Deinococcus ruber]
MPPKTKAKKSASTSSSKPVRTVYEVISPQGRREIEASTTVDLTELLTPLLPALEPYTIRAVARLLSLERANVTAVDWSVKRLGVLVFEAVNQPSRSSSHRASKATAGPETEEHEAAMNV